MNVKRYFAKTAREALRMLKEDLGPDAVVLSNRAANGGVEILALPAGDVATLQRARAQAAAQNVPIAPPPAAPAPRPKLAEDFFDDDFRVSLSRAAGARPATPPAPAPAAQPVAPVQQAAPVTPVQPAAPVQQAEKKEAAPVEQKAPEKKTGKPAEKAKPAAEKKAKPAEKPKQAAAKPKPAASAPRPVVQTDGPGWPCAGRAAPSSKG